MMSRPWASVILDSSPLRGDLGGGRAVRLLQELDEPAYGGWELLLATVDDPDRTDEIGNAEGHDGERPDSRLLLHRVPGQDADARGDHDRLLDGLDVVELHHDVRLDVGLAERAVDRFADRQLAVERHEGLAIEVRGHDRPAPRQPVPWLANERHGLPGPEDDREPRARCQSR